MLHRCPTSPVAWAVCYHWFHVITALPIHAPTRNMQINIRNCNVFPCLSLLRVHFFISRYQTVPISKVSEVEDLPFSDTVTVRNILRTRLDLRPTSLLYNGYRVVPGGKAAEAWHWPPTPSSAKVKERVQRYIYSPYGPSWPILGWTFIIHCLIYP